MNRPLLLRTHVARREAAVDTLIPHKDDGQVRLDVIRSFTHLSSETSKRSLIFRRTKKSKRKHERH